MIPRTLEPEVMDTVEEAVDYDGMDHSTVNQIFVDDLLEVIRNRPIPADAKHMPLIMDLGTGTVRIPLLLAERWSECPPIAACDLSVEMLRLGNEHIRSSGRSSRIVPVLCDAKRLPAADASVALMISNSIIHHIPDPADVFREVRRCLAVPGVLFFRDLLRPETSQDVEHLVQTYAGDENAHQQQMFRESLHAALSLSEVNALLSTTGFAGVRAEQTTDRHWTIAAVVR